MHCESLLLSSKRSSDLQSFECGVQACIKRPIKKKSMY